MRKVKREVLQEIYVSQTLRILFYIMQGGSSV